MLWLRQIKRRFETFKESVKKNNNECEDAINNEYPTVCRRGFHIIKDGKYRTRRGFYTPNIEEAHVFGKAKAYKIVENERGTKKIFVDIVTTYRYKED